MSYPNIDRNYPTQTQVNRPTAAVNYANEPVNHVPYDEPSYYSYQREYNDNIPSEVVDAPYYDQDPYDDRRGYIDRRSGDPSLVNQHHSGSYSQYRNEYIRPNPEYHVREQVEQSMQRISAVSSLPESEYHYYYKEPEAYPSNYVSKMDEPRKCDIPVIQDLLNGTEKRTVVMIRNIPNRYKNVDLQTVFDTTAKNLYKIIYLPQDAKTTKNLGYAFIRFYTTTALADTMMVRQGQRWPNSNSQKRCMFYFAQFQEKKTEALGHSAVVNSLPVRSIAAPLSVPMPPVPSYSLGNPMILSPPISLYPTLSTSSYITTSIPPPPSHVSYSPSSSTPSNSIASTPISSNSSPTPSIPQNNINMNNIPTNNNNNKINSNGPMTKTNYTTPLPMVPINNTQTYPINQYNYM
ncbi:hypothetical protein WA158_008019 [Blastocystis sp. Blastoise]